jgi:hypothetical protein
MAEKKPQNLENHTKLDPAFHMFLIPGALLLFAGAVYNAYQNGFQGAQGLRSAEFLLASVWAIVALFKIRLYALKVQDRVIRLEELLRMERLLPEQLKSRVYEITEQQFIALRFASDGEIPTLVEKTLAGNLEPKAIKAAIQSWRPDYWRV